MRHLTAVLFALAFGVAATAAQACPGALDTASSPKTTVASGEKAPGSTKIQIPTKG